MVVKMKATFIVALFASSIFHAVYSTEHPEAEISNGAITAKLYLPDAENGYYTSTRFDWSGIIHDLEYRGHTYLGSWIPEPNSLSFVDKLGPADVFSPIIHSSSDAGEKIIKIGVGLLSLPAGVAYKEKSGAPISDHGTWTVEQDPDRIRFIHELTAVPYAYEYSKEIRLVENSSKMILAHSLKNTGSATIETSVYNHNFFVIDQQPVGNGVEISFTEPISGSHIKNDNFIITTENTIQFTQELDHHDHINSRSISGYSDGLNLLECAILDRRTGAGVRINSDRPISNLAVWCYYKSICPEPYTSIEVAPGETFAWNYDYTFFLENE